MRILHYSLGFPPFRTGGMTKYCMDLMKEQCKMNHKVYLLWPGVITNFEDEIKIYQRKDYHIDDNLYISSFEIVNPLPVPLLDGIKHFKEYTQYKDKRNIEKFFKKNKIEVVHVHTLMGLPKEFLEVCSELKIKMVYTSHDYFGLCPKWGLFKCGEFCKNDHNCEDCIECNKTALSLKKIKILQSSIYRIIKNNIFVKWLRKLHNNNLYQETNYNIKKQNKIKSKENVMLSMEYIKLRKYYIDMLNLFDVLHFNSKNTKDIYNKYFDTNNTGTVINISHKSINDNRKLKSYSNNFVKFGYLGPITQHKGFFLLKEVMDNIVLEFPSQNIELHIFAEYSGEEQYLVKHKPYKYEDLESVMNCFDILIVPSVWNETFGFTVLEALSYGVPVIVTSNVGAKDLIVPDRNGYIVEPNKISLNNCVKKIVQTPQVMVELNKYIYENMSIMTLQEHNQKIMNIYSAPLRA